MITQPHNNSLLLYFYYQINVNCLNRNCSAENCHLKGKEKRRELCSSKKGTECGVMWCQRLGVGILSSPVKKGSRNPWAMR